MGRDLVRLEITASVSRHNSEEDERDDQLWDELCEKIDALVDDDRYASIGPVRF